MESLALDPGSKVRIHLPPCPKAGSFIRPASAQSFFRWRGCKSPFQRRKQKVRICPYLFFLLFYSSWLILVMENFPPPFWGKAERLRHWLARHAGQGLGWHRAVQAPPGGVICLSSAFHSVVQSPRPHRHHCLPQAKRHLPHLPGFAGRIFTSGRTAGCVILLQICQELFPKLLRMRLF